jgi:hypothetical protein
MPEQHVVRISPDGTVQFINKAALDRLKAAGPVVLRRASHVEPAAAPLRWLFHLLRGACGEAGAVAAFTRAWPCRWRVNLGPSGGPVLPARYRDRELAIDAEVAWLQANRLGVKPAAGPAADGVVVQAPAAGPAADHPALGTADRPEVLASAVADYMDRLDRAKARARLHDVIRDAAAISETDRDDLVRVCARAEPVLLTVAEVETILDALDPWARFRSPVVRLSPAQMAVLRDRLRRAGAYSLADKLGG